MALIALLVLLVIPVIEIWAAFAVAGQIGGFLTVLALIGLSVLGVWTLKLQGVASWRTVSKELAEGRSPGTPMLDGLIAMIGAFLLVIPGFVTALAGGLLLLPPVRSLLRPLILAWMTKRIAAASSRSRFGGMIVTSRVDGHGNVHSQAATVGDVIDSEGWDLAPSDFGSNEILPGPSGSSRDGGRVIDTDGRPSTGR